MSTKQGLLLFVCMTVCLCVDTAAWVPNEVNGSPEAGVIGGYKLSDMNIGNQT